MDNSRDYSKLIQQYLLFMYNLREAFSRHQPEIWSMLRERGYDLLSDPYGRFFNTILVLGNMERCTMSDVAEYFNLSPATATGLIDKMVGMKLVKRINSPEDRRVVLIILDEIGNVIFEKAQEFQRMNVQSMFEDFSNEELEKAIQMMEKINRSTAFKK